MHRNIGVLPSLRASSPRAPGGTVMQRMFQSLVPGWNICEEVIALVGSLGGGHWIFSRKILTWMLIFGGKGGGGEVEFQFLPQLLMVHPCFSGTPC